MTRRHEVWIAFVVAVFLAVVVAVGVGAARERANPPHPLDTPPPTQTPGGTVPPGEEE